MKQKLPIFVLIAFGFLTISLIIYFVNCCSYYGDDEQFYLIMEILEILIRFSIGIMIVCCCFILKDKVKSVNISIVYLVAQTVLALLCITIYDQYYIYLLCLLVSAIGILIYAFDLSQNGIFITEKEEKDINKTTLSSTEAMHNLEKLKGLKDSGVLTEEEFVEKSKPYIEYL